MAEVAPSPIDSPAPRVFISYAHESEAHAEAVRDLWVLLRSQGVNARLDLPAAERRQDWPLWMLREVREADFVLVIASPEYRKRAEGDAKPDDGRGVQFEAQLIREEVYRDREAALEKFLPVVLPDASPDDIPTFLGPATATSYQAASVTVDDCESLLRVLTEQPWEVEPPLGDRPVLPARGVEVPVRALRPILSHNVTLDITREAGHVRCRTALAGTPLGEHGGALPVDIDGVWHALTSPPGHADERLTEAGHALRRALLDDETIARLMTLVDFTPLGTVVDIAFETDEDSLGLPFELLRLPDGRLLATVPGVRMHRQGRDLERPDGTPLPGPLKILVAVAAPDESRTDSSPLDIEAEMQTILDAITDTDLRVEAQVKILEVASPAEITAALRADQYHVLHLSAHGSAAGVELEDEDGNPVPVGSGELVRCLRAGGRPLPLVVLSSCAGAGDGANGLAAALVRQGADRVVAMQAPVTDRYATALARHLYGDLGADETMSVAGALAEARRQLDDERTAALRSGTQTPPESAVATLFTRGEDPPLVDTRTEPEPLPHPAKSFGGGEVRRLSIGELIGRRRQLRTALVALRGGPPAKEQFGALAGVMLTGVGGIGKTALAGRIEGRLAGEGWLTAVHHGSWDPPALTSAVVAALVEAGDELSEARALLIDGTIDDTTKFHAVCSLLSHVRLLLLFDDFEQNLELDGSFRDPGFAGSFDTLLQAATVGQILVTTRYPIVDSEPFLLPVPIPPLSTAELQRMLLRLPALRDLDRDERRTLVRTVGGHPRLLEFLNALLRNGRGNLHEVTVKLRDLARRQGVATGPMPFEQALNETIVLGSRDILLDHLLGVIDEDERELLLQAAVSRIPLSLMDLAVARWGPAPTDEQRDETAAGAGRLQDLTLLSSVGDRDVFVHPWIGQSLQRKDFGGEIERHERAFAMRLARINSGQVEFSELIEACHHLAGADRADGLVQFALEATAAIGQQLGEMSVAAFCGEILPMIAPDSGGFLLLADREAAALEKTGNSRAAIERMQLLLEITRAKAEAEPANPFAQRNLSVTYDRLGDLAYDRGDTAQAEQLHRDSLDIAKRLASNDPTNTELQRDLSISYDRLGDLARNHGDTAQAEELYRDSLDIIKRLATADPTNTELQRDLSVSYARFGDLARNRGHTAQAEQLYRDSLDIAERLATNDPTNTELQRDLSVSYDRLGDLADDRGDTAQAEQLHHNSLDIRKRLATNDPTNTQLQRDLSISYNRLGDLAHKRGDDEQANALLQEGVRAAERAAQPLDAQQESNRTE